MQQRIALATAANDVKALEELAVEIKGTPGLATMRKTIKKHIKKITDKMTADLLSAQRDRYTPAVEPPAVKSIPVPKMFLGPTVS